MTNIQTKILKLVKLIVVTMIIEHSLVRIVEYVGHNYGCSMYKINEINYLIVFVCSIVFMYIWMSTGFVQEFLKIIEVWVDKK